MQYVLMTLYALSLGFTTLYTLVQLHLVFTRRRTAPDLPIDAAIAAELSGAVTPDSTPTAPFVTIQLPVYNELYVVERLLEAVAAIDYPRDRVEIQVLDDSTDESVDIAARKITALRLRQPDLQITHVRREDRTGFKAGALDRGLESARGEFIAIFDADFLPEPDFLQRTIPCFTDPRVAIVQTRWGHLNEQYSLLTQLQALALDAHFVVEQTGRYRGGYMQNFNGTAGIWRRTAIEDAGGWEHDTITEDIDLSYRAQLRGWRLVYLPDVESPAELPADMHGFRSQQFRWTKGTAECARKLLGRVLRSRLPISTRIHACGHLLYWLNYPAIVISAIVSIPLALLYGRSEEVRWFLMGSSVFITGMVAMTTVFWVAHGRFGMRRGIRRLSRFLMLFPAFVSFYIGLSLHNSIAGLEGLLRISSPFVRTPKFAIVNRSDNWLKRGHYLSRRLSWVTWLEGGCALLFAVAIVLEARSGIWMLVPYHMMVTAGFGAVFFLSLLHTLPGGTLAGGDAETASIDDPLVSDFSTPAETEEFAAIDGSGAALSPVGSVRRASGDPEAERDTADI